MRAPDFRPARSPARPKPRRAPVLIVLHQEHSTPGRVGRLIAERGHGLDIRRPRYGDPLPDDLSHHAGVVIFGGPMSANDDDDWIHTELGLIGRCLRQERPYLGLCLGAQMLVRELGARVYAHERGIAEIGYYPIRPTPEGEAEATRIGSPWPGHVYHWHREGFDCPAGARILAEGEDFPVQAIAVGARAYGLQFHPEVTQAMIHRWTTRAAERLSAPGAQPAHLQLQGRFMHDRAVEAWLHAFLDHWLDRTALAASGP